MPDTRPFVLIAGIRRTGSTLLAEALTELPRAFVVREPRLFRGRNDLKPADVDRLRAGIGLDLSGVAAEPKSADARHAARRFRVEVAAPLLERAEQIGIKEIRYDDDWRKVLRELRQIAPVRVVATGREPRDIYISLAHLSRQRRIRLPGPFAPETVAADVGREFELQRTIIRATGALTVRYEDLCTDPRVLDAVRVHVESPVTGRGIVGEFKERNRVVHGREITDRRVARWRSEHDADLVADAHQVIRQLEDYCEFWRYSMP